MRESARDGRVGPAVDAWEGRFPVDAHVHFHPCFSAGAFLDGARANFRAASGPGPGRGPLGVLLFTDPSGHDGFGRVRDAVAGAAVDWSVCETDEAESVIVRHADGTRLVLVAGRQIATAEGLEVLTLARVVAIPDGLPLRKTVALARRAGGVPVVPWGFGKWWGRRGKLLRGALRALPPGAFYLGDNAARPRGATRSALLRCADAHGRPVLPGSDPLPFARHATRAGAYGSWIEGRIVPRRPAASLRRMLGGLDASPEPFGRRTSWARCVRDQVAMQLRNRRPNLTRGADRTRRTHSRS